jgi:hypothetical protein
MVSLAQLWAPILLSAILVFVASSIIHMLIQWHKGDYKALQNEDEVRAAIRKGNPPPALYILPFCSDMKKMAEPDAEEVHGGPNAVLTIIKPGPSMGPCWGNGSSTTFISGCGLLAAASSTGTGTYRCSRWQDCGLAGVCRATLRFHLDGAALEHLDQGHGGWLIYAGMTGSFGWLWPKLAPETSTIRLSLRLLPDVLNCRMNAKV